jgi:hypothetical protein
MDPLSLTIAIFGLPTVLVTTAEMLRKAVKSIKYAEREILDLAREMEWFDGTCKRFALCANEASEIVGHLKSWSKKAKVGYVELLKKVQVMATQPLYRQFTIKTLLARLRWNQSKSFTKHLRASLSVARAEHGRLHKHLSYRKARQGNCMSQIRPLYLRDRMN